MEILNAKAFLLLIFIPLFFRKKRLKVSKIILYSSKNYYLLIAFLLLIIALSRPVINNGTITVKLPKTNVIAAIDISKNMLKKDFYPNNFEFVKNKFSKFLDYLNDEEVAVVLFNQNVYLLSPYSRDYNSIKYLLKHLPKINAVEEADYKTLFKKTEEFKGPKILIIFTASPVLDEVNPKIRVFVYALKNDNTFKNLTKTTNGAFILAGYSDTDIKNLAKLINSINKEKVIKIKDKKELFYYPLFLGILFLFLGLFKVNVKWKMENVK
ncbi:Ca-activated chloride channel homolog [Lebetimonas natsushimae]|uniref:Ca-activated chloride channel homolog n=1 Tax=Lebetimonas natsushimae TaxID=1936991 RepID=A0A292YBA8_9BACT|nr:VWA domain-containing protein [Lebetimonas natsushimae]GAX87048.1 Ca-activated chloride channel homolog [Lebetimonas natsushimae]